MCLTKHATRPVCRFERPPNTLFGFCVPNPASAAPIRSAGNNRGSRTEAAAKKGIDTPKVKIVYYCNDMPCGFVGGGMRGGVLPNPPP